MARKPLALLKEMLTIELDRELFNKWCSIGNALNLTTNSQIAQYLVLCYRSQDQSEINICETCGAMLTRHCARCTNEKSSWNAKSRKRPRERDEGQNTQNLGETVHSTAKTKSLTNKTDTVHSELVGVKNEPVDNVVGDMNIDQEQTQPYCMNIPSERDGRQNMQNPGQTVQTIVKKESSENESDTVHSDPDGVKNEPADSVVGYHNIDHDQTQQCCVKTMLPPLKECDSSPSSLSQAEDLEENLVNCNDSTKTCAPLPSTSLRAGNAESDKGIQHPSKDAVRSKLWRQQRKDNPNLCAEYMTAERQRSKIARINRSDAQKAAERKKCRERVRLWRERNTAKTLWTFWFMPGTVFCLISAWIVDSPFSAGLSVTQTMEVSALTLDSFLYVSSEEKAVSSTSAGLPLTSTPKRPQPERTDHLCPHCGKSYGNNRALTRHLRLHHEYKCSFECQICHKRFREASHLHSHTNSVHLKTKLYSCFQCNKKFADKRNVNPKRHRCAVINARTTCEHCLKTYSSETSLHDHEKRVHFNRYYSCETCLAQFKFRAQLSRHARKCMI